MAGKFLAPHLNRFFGKNFLVFALLKSKIFHIKKPKGNLQINKKIAYKLNINYN